MWVRLVLEVLVVVPSPKSQNRFVIVPAEKSLKATVSGISPLVGLALKLATGARAPEPLRPLVAAPPPLLTTSALLKAATPVGLKLTTTLVDPNPARLNDAPDRTVKGPLLMVA